MDVLDITNGKVTENSGVLGQLSLVQQPGIIPAPEQEQ